MKHIFLVILILLVGCNRNLKQDLRHYIDQQLDLGLTKVYTTLTNKYNREIIESLKKDYKPFVERLIKQTFNGQKLDKVWMLIKDIAKEQSRYDNRATNFYRIIFTNKFCEEIKHPLDHLIITHRIKIKGNKYETYITIINRATTFNFEELEYQVKVFHNNELLKVFNVNKGPIKVLGCQTLFAIFDKKPTKFELKVKRYIINVKF